MAIGEIYSPKNLESLVLLNKESSILKVFRKIRDIFNSAYIQYTPKKKVNLEDFYKKNQNYSPNSKNKFDFKPKNSSEIQILNQSQIDEMIKKEHKDIVIIDNLIYDITKWKNQHPGGHEVIDLYQGVDATEQFYAFHRPRVAKRLNQFLIGQVEQKKEISKTEQQYKNLRYYLWENNYFTSDENYYNKKYLSVIVLFLLTIFLAWNQNYILAAITVGQFVKQSAYIGHDAYHYGIMAQQPGQKFNLQGMFFISALFGIAGDMWNDEHTLHHAITRRPMEDPQFTYLPLFLLSEKELTWKKYKVNWLAKILVKIQHFSYMPLAVLIGRFNIYFVSLFSILKTRKYKSLVGLALYWMWYIPIVFLIEGSYERWVYIVLNHWIIGILHVQLLLNHFAVEAFTEEEERQMDFFTFQVRTSRNISAYWWNEWFYGGLNYQVEHHLFPQLPRHNLSLIQGAVKEICQDNNIQYLEQGFWYTLYVCTSYLKEMAGVLIRADLQ